MSRRCPTWSPWSSLRPWSTGWPGVRGKWWPSYVLLCHLTKQEGVEHSLWNSQTETILRHNIADSVTSISCGLLMTMVGLFSKVLLLIYLFVHFSNKITTCHIMNHRQLVFQPMPGSTLITGSLLFKLCPYFQSVQFKLFAALEWILRFNLVKNFTNMPLTNSTNMPFFHLLHP